MGWVVSVTPRPPFTPGKGSPLPIGLESGWTSELVWTQKLEEKTFVSARRSNPGCSIYSISFYLMLNCTWIFVIFIFPCSRNTLVMWYELPDNHSEHCYLHCEAHRCKRFVATGTCCIKRREFHIQGFGARIMLLQNLNFFLLLLGLIQDEY
jgi:hypothetical protein